MSQPLKVFFIAFNRSFLNAFNKHESKMGAKTRCKMKPVLRINLILA